MADELANGRGVLHSPLAEVLLPLPSPKNKDTTMPVSLKYWHAIPKRLCTAGNKARES